MKRIIDSALRKWKDDIRRKPLLLTGVRQCGKTYSLKKFGEECFENTVYLNFEENTKLSELFEQDLDVNRIVREISILERVEIRPGKTLLILDEIQECPRAITALKYFCENMRALHVACAGSLLGVALNRENISFPVGKVNRLFMYPLNFKEFLYAAGDEGYVDILKEWNPERPVPDLYSEPLQKRLKEFYFTGGMPDAVAAWIEDNDTAEVDSILDEILRDYSDDFAKHAPINQTEKIRWIWDSVPKQLAKENNKFVFSHVKAGKRAAELEDALLWLRDAGLVRLLELVEKPEIPLSSMADATYFKVYMSDIGLLRRRAGLTYNTLVDEDPYYIKFKGALAENYVYNELVTLGKECYFWRSENTAEIDFLIEAEHSFVPIEVKSADNVKAKSYSRFCKKYGPSIGYKMSMKNIAENENDGTKTYNLPLWMIWNIDYYK